MAPNDFFNQKQHQSQQNNTTTSESDSDEESTDVNLSDVRERSLRSIALSSSDSEDNPIEACLQHEIQDPANAIVQQQINGNEVKMLEILDNGDQRLITFDIPREDCTVKDLLESVNIKFFS